MSPLTLAFLGDAVYEVLVREQIVSSGSAPINTLHKMSVDKVCAKAQSKAVDSLLYILTEEEAEILKRGRNANSAKVPKSSTANDYRKATGLESLFGYLYLNGKIKRINEIFSYIYQINENDILKDDK